MLKKAALPLAILTLSGCASMSGNSPQSPEHAGEIPLPMEVAMAPQKNPNTYPAIEYRSPGQDHYFRVSRMEPTDPLPEVGIQVLSVNNASVYDSLRMLLLDLNINLSMSHTIANKTGMYMVHGEGTLPYIVEEIAKATNLFYTYKNNTLSFSERETFVFKIPPMLDEEAENDIINTLVSLGIDSSAIDTRFNTVTFQADRRQLKPARSYLESIAQAGSVIVFDTWIWEVALNKEHRSGVRWDELNIGSGNTSLNLSGGVLSSAESTANLLGAIAHTTDKLSVSGLVSFLKNHGTLSTLSQPKISLISGSSAKMEVGEEVKYVSELTSTVSSSGDTTQSSATTETLSTGLKLDIYGAFEQDTVFSKIGLDISDLLRFNEFTASGTVLSLPHTVIRKVETDTRIKPGEYFILGGVNMSRKQNDDSSTPGLFGMDWLTLPFSKSKATTKSELVIVMRPRVIVFAEAPEVATPDTPVSKDQAEPPKDTDTDAPEAQS